MHCEEKLKLRSPITSYGLIEVVTKARLLKVKYIVLIWLCRFNGKYTLSDVSSGPMKPSCPPRFTWSSKYERYTKLNITAREYSFECEIEIFISDI